MTLIRTTSPLAEPVSLGELKQHLRITHTGDDDHLSALIRAARETVERESATALIRQQFRLLLDNLPEGREIAFPVHPVASVDAIVVFDSDGNSGEFPVAETLLDGFGHPPRLVLLSRPQVGRAANGIEIDFTAGFGESAVDVPEGLRRAVLLLAAHWFEFRAEIPLESQPASYPAAYDRLIAPWRRVRI